MSEEKQTEPKRPPKKVDIPPADPLGRNSIEKMEELTLEQKKRKSLLP